MTNVLVGDKDCTFQDVVKIFQQSPCSNSVTKNWRSLARSLSTPKVLVTQKNQRLMLNTLTEFDVVEDLLEEWRNRMSEKSTLGELLRIVESELEWKEIAVSLRNIIKDKAKTWSDLDEYTKSEIFSMKIFFQGQPTSLELIKVLVGKEKLETILCEFFTEDLLKRDLRKETWCLDNWNVAEKLPYYIERTLKMRNQLNPKIFEQKCSDIFVFEGITRPNLSKLSKSETTDISSNQLENVTVRFIILELETDFKAIQKLSTSPIHKIKFENGVYNWLLTIGSTKLIRKFLLDEYEEFSEEEFVMKRLSQFTSRPTAIVDSAGMGKSTLLNSIASTVKSIYPKRIVLVHKMRELVAIIEKSHAADEILVFTHIIAKATCTSMFGIEVIEEMMNNMSLEFEIFLDGFDEMSGQQLVLLRPLLKEASKSKNMRVHVTSRFYLQEELEETFEVVSLNIVPFSEKDQLKFLSCYWNSEFIPGSQERLKEFAAKSLASIQDKVKDTKKDIAGIPLQCYILSEVYTDAAMRYAHEDNKTDKVLIGVKSISELYTKFVDQRFEKVATEDWPLLKLVHYYYALVLLFPHSETMTSTKFLKSVSAEVSFSKIFSIGIINSENLNGTLNFQHRTFAEFLLAEHLIAQLPILFGDHNMCNFFFNEVLEVTKTTYGVPLTDFIVERFIDLFELTFARRKRTKQYKSLVNALISDPARRFVLDCAYINRNSLKGLISYWVYVNETIPILHNLLGKIRIDLGWDKLADDFEKLCVRNYRLEFQHSSICYFMNAILSATGYSLEPTMELKIQNVHNIEEASQYFVQQSFACAVHNFSLLFPLLELWFYNQALDKSLINKTWHEVLICASGHDDVKLFEMFCSFLLKVCNQNWWEVSFPNKSFMNLNYVHLPLHEAVQRGNYRMTEHLLKFYDIKTLGKTALFFNCALATSSAPTCVVKSKLEICQLLFEKDHNFFSEVDHKKCIVGLLGVNAKFLKLIIDSDCERKNVRLQSSLMVSICPYASVDDVDDLVDYLVSKNLTDVLFVRNKSGLNAIQWCLACDTLKPETMLRINKSFPFDITKLNTKRFKVLDCIFKSKWGESWANCINDNFGIDIIFWGLQELATKTNKNTLKNIYMPNIN